MQLVKFSNRFPSIFDRYFYNDPFEWMKNDYSGTNTTLPSVNIKESPEDFEVEMAAPGLTRDDFRIEINRDLLTISSVKEYGNEINEKEHFTLREFSYQSFTRSFTLPNSADSSKIEAKYDRGILNVIIPKKDEAKPRPPRQITVL